MCIRDRPTRARSLCAFALANSDARRFSIRANGSSYFSATSPTTICAFRKKTLQCFSVRAHVSSQSAAASPKHSFNAGCQPRPHPRDTSVCEVFCGCGRGWRTALKECLHHRRDLDPNPCMPTLLLPRPFPANGSACAAKNLSWAAVAVAPTIVGPRFSRRRRAFATQTKTPSELSTGSC